MIAIGEYVLINIPPTIIGGIHVKNDGYGICISAPSLPHIEGKKVMLIQTRNIMNMKTM